MEVMTLNKPLKYLIGYSRTPLRHDGMVVECPYDSDNPGGDTIGYCNLFDESNTGEYGPYLHSSDTASEYHEGQIDPKGPGWKKNLTEQFTKRKEQSFEYVELDNPDAYDKAAVLDAVHLAKANGLKVIAKNPGLCEDPQSYVRQCEGIIVERGAGSPNEMDALRRKVGKDEMPVWFVFFGDGIHEAHQLDVSKYSNMWVSISSVGEYENSIQVSPNDG